MLFLLLKRTLRTLYTHNTCRFCNRYRPCVLMHRHSLYFTLLLLAIEINNIEATRSISKQQDDTRTNYSIPNPSNTTLSGSSIQIESIVNTGGAALRIGPECIPSCRNTIPSPIEATKRMTTTTIR